MKTKNNQVVPMALGLIGSYGLLYNKKTEVDPYTRAAIGMMLGAGLFISNHPLVRYLGIGMAIGGALQITDVLKGGRIISNNSTMPVYILHESNGIIELALNQVPDYHIDGFTFKGLNGIYKISDGVFAKLNANNQILIPGLGGYVNQIRRGGYKTKEWIHLQTDPRWKELYRLSY
jgi:hypothetical protein